MEIGESKTSRISQVNRLVTKYFPKLKITYDEDHPSELRFCKKQFISGFEIIKIRIHAPHRIFDKGEWDNIEIDVMDESYFEGAKKLGQDYENISNKKAMVIKIF